MSTVTITYAAPAAVAARATTAQICRTFAPNNAAADMAPFEGTYYDTNVDGWGEGMATLEFLTKNIFHAGLLGAFKKAMLTGEAELTDLSDEEAIYAEEVGTALADQGFSVEVA